MRILVVSDSHGDEEAVWRAVETQPSAGAVIHLGDGAREFEAVAARYPDKRFYNVRGNGDWGCHTIPDTGEELFSGRRVFFTHGHLYGVKTGLYRVVCAARERKADILLFGHTHMPLEDYEEGLFILNPGSIAHGGSYGIVDITPAGVVTNVVENRL